MNKFNLPVDFKNYASIIAAVSFFIVALISVFVLWPKLQDLKIIQKEINGKEAELQSKEGYLLKLSETKTRLEGYRDELSKIDSAVPNDPSLPSLFNYIQETCSESGLVLTDIGPFKISAIEGITGLKEAVFDIEVSGSYSSFKIFLSVLEKSARMIEAENVSFSSPLEEREPFIFNLTIKAHSY